MKNKILIFISRTLKLIALLVPLVCLVHFAQENLFYFEDYNTRRIELFYEEEEDSLDVVIIGASETFAGFVPGLAYECYGFTSYLYSIDSNTGSIYKSTVKEIMKHQDPQVILVDIYGFLSGEGWDFYDEPRFRTYIESIPFSMNKVMTILEHPFEDKISYFVPLVKYHGELKTAQERLKALNAPEKEFPDLKGIVSESVIYQDDGDPGYDVNLDTYQLSEGSRECLLDFLKYIEKEGLDNIVFVNFPRYLKNLDNNSWLAMISRVEEILNEHGYPLFDMQKEIDQIGLNMSRDFYNQHHLNIYGQMTLTDYLSSKLVNEYGVVPTPQSEENQVKWENCVLDTRQYFAMADALIYSGKHEQIFEMAYAWLSPEQILNGG